MRKDEVRYLGSLTYDRRVEWHKQHEQRYEYQYARSQNIRTASAELGTRIVGDYAHERVGYSVPNTSNHQYRARDSRGDTYYIRQKFEVEYG